MKIQNDFDRLVFFEHARRSAQVAYGENPRDTENLTRWGEALLELSTFQSVEKSKTMIKDAISKLDEALSIDPAKHGALWCKGNAQTSFACLTLDEDEVNSYFDSAYTNFRLAVDKDPGNELYRRSFEVAKLPGLKAKGSSNLKYIFGSVVLALAIVAWVRCRKQ